MANFGGIELLNDARGVYRADGKPWGMVANANDMFAPPGNSWAEIQASAKSGNPSALGADLSPYAKQIMDWQDGIASTEDYGSKGFDGFMEKYAPAIILSVFGGGALAAAGAAGGAAAAGAGEAVSGFYGATAAELGSAAASYGAGAAGAGEAVSGMYGATAGELGSAAASYGGGAADAAWGANQGGSAMDLGDWQDWSQFLDSGGGSSLEPAGGWGDALSIGEQYGAGTYGTTAGSGGLMEAFNSLKNLPTSALKALGLTNNDGSLNSGSLASILGKLGAAGLGAYGSSQQSNSLTELANKYSEYGAPSRARFEASMTPGFDPMSIPGYSGALDTASKGILARLSATGGNPWGNPGGLIDANKQIIAGTALPAINEYQRTNLNAGGLGNMNAAIPGLQQGAIGADGNVLNAFGYGLNAATQQQPQQQSLADLMKALNLGGLA